MYRSQQHTRISCGLAHVLPIAPASLQDMIDAMIEHLYALPSIALNRRGTMEESVCVHLTAEKGSRISALV